MISAGDNCFALFIIVFYFLHHQCTNLQRKSEQSDESVSIVVIIHITGCEGCQRLVVQAIWRSCTGFDDVAFVQFPVME